MPRADEIPQHLAQNPFLDLSGVDTTAFSNPYDALLHATNNDLAQLQERYSTHRLTRNAQQKAKLLDTNFSGVIVDPILERLENPTIEPGFVDPRHCFTVWGRPPQHIKKLIGEVQERIKKAAPSLWLMPLDNSHITIVEITHSKTAEEIEVLKNQVAPHADLVNYTLNPEHRARLVKPFIGYDASALALSFVPAADEGDTYSYHHLRRDCVSILDEAGIKVQSRYVVPSAHLTIGRFITQKDFASADGTVDPTKMDALVQVIEETNEWLKEYHWGSDHKSSKEGGEWTVGEEKGLDLRFGTIWYGGGESLAVGKGF